MIARAQAAPVWGTYPAPVRPDFWLFMDGTFYTFSLNIQQGLAVGGLAVLGLLAIVSSDPRRNKRHLFGTVITAIMVFATVLVACSKKDNDQVAAKPESVFIRVLQVDKDGGKSYSKIVRALTEE